MRLTNDPDGPVLGCPRCDTALLPMGEWPRSGAAKAECPLCGWEELLTVLEVGEAFPFNPEQQREDAASSPVYPVEAITYDEDLCLVHVAGLLEDPAFFALQDGVAPVQYLGWVGGEGLLGDPNYRLLLVVRVQDQPERDLFRIEFPAERLADLAGLNDDQTMVLVSGRKGVLFAEGGEEYLEAVRSAGAGPGGRVRINTWVTLEDGRE
ncbi:MAG: hypothetical protein ACOY93_18920 [Bacillota bacterium]